MATIYTPKKYRDNFHHHLDRIESGEVLAGSIPTGIKKIDDILIPIGPTDLGIILANSGHGKCLAKGTKVIMFNGSMKNVEDIQIGDVLMGPDSSPRNVLSISRGREQMYWVRQSNAMDYRVNESHILSLTSPRLSRMGRCVNKSITELYSEYKYDFNERKTLMGYRSISRFPLKYTNQDAYLMGVYIGHVYDDMQIIFVDKKSSQIVADLLNQFVYRISHGYVVSNSTVSDIGNYLFDKYQMNRDDIMLCIRTASISERIEFIRGLMDSLRVYYREELLDVECQDVIELIKYIFNSLGYNFIVKNKNLYAILAEIDFLYPSLRRKKYSRRISTNLSNIKIVKDIVDDYYGFVIDGDHLFLLEDFTVTHNTSYMMHMMLIACEMYNANRDKYAPPIYVTRETAIEEILLRLLSNYATIDIGDIKRNKSYLNWKDMHDHANKMMEEYPIIFIGHSMYSSDTRKTLSAQKVIEDVDKIHQNLGNPSILIDIDYLQRFDWDGESDRRMSLFKCVDGFKDMALESNTTVLLGCQARREVADKTYPIPLERDALETSNIEHTADWMVSLLRPCKYWEVGTIIPKSKNNVIVTPDLFYLHILKQRSGETNIGSYCSFDARIFSFADIND